MFAFLSGTSLFLVITILQSIYMQNIFLKYSTKFLLIFLLLLLFLLLNKIKMKIFKYYLKNNLSRAAKIFCPDVSSNKKLKFQI